MKFSVKKGNIFAYLKEYGIIFGIGAVCYGLIEILCRGYTHPSMLIAGGTSLVLLGIIDRHMRTMHRLYKHIAGALIISLIELVCGVIFNIILKQHVWDYSNIPLNLGGQVCLLYTVMWGFLSGLAFFIERSVRRRLHTGLRV